MKVCPKCGCELNDDACFCSRCGTPVDIPAAEESDPEMQTPATPAVMSSPVPEKEPDAVLTTEKSQVPPPDSAFAPEKKNRKGVIIGAVAAVLVIAGIGTGMIIIHNHKINTYNEAAACLQAGDFATASEKFGSLGNYEDAAELKTYADNRLNYAEAGEMLESGSYAGALELYISLGGFSDAADKAALCEQYVRYEEAVSLMKECEYEQAKEIFTALSLEDENVTASAQMCSELLEFKTVLQELDNGGWTDIESLPELSEETIAFFTENDSNLLSGYKIWGGYYDAIALFNDGAYYQAMQAFKKLGDLGYAEEYIEKCPQKDPGTKELYHNNRYISSALYLQIVPPKDESRTVIKVYTEDDFLVSTVFIAAGSTYTIKLPGGNYRIKAAYSYGDWYGETDLFGDSGTYQRMLNGSSEIFELESGYTYTLTLRTDKTTGDTVNTQSESRGTF